jgi:hypothetical protein
MELISRDAKVWWISNADEIRPPHATYFLTWVDQLKKKFNFVTAPLVLPSPGEPVVYREGVVAINGREIVIREMTVFNDGISVYVPSSTDDAAIALGAILEFATTLGVKTPITPPQQFFESNLVFELYKPIDSLIVHYEMLSNLINKHIGGPGHSSVTALSFSSDPALIAPKVNSTVFRIERRANTPFERNRYFSFANMTTEAHVEVVSKLELLLKAPAQS